MDLPLDPGGASRSFTERPTKIAGGQTAEYELYEQDGKYVLRIELPGFERDDIQVRWHESTLRIRASNDAENPRRERTANRAYHVDIDVNPDEIQARYRAGLLDIYLPATESDQRGTTIPVEEKPNP